MKASCAIISPRKEMLNMLNLLWVIGAVIDILRGVNNDDFDD